MRYMLLLIVGLFFALAPPGFAEQKYERSVVNINVPDVVLQNQNGQRVRLKELLASDRPVIVDFIYGTCTTICPILSAGFSNFQKKLGADSQRVHLVSITIDPEHDTPPVMKQYLERYRAKPGWDFLSGRRQDVERVMTAFDAYFRDKMDHEPLNFIRTGKDGSWVRLYGLMSSRDFLNEFDKAVN